MATPATTVPIPSAIDTIVAVSAVCLAARRRFLAMIVPSARVECRSRVRDGPRRQCHRREPRNERWRDDRRLEVVVQGHADDARAESEDNDGRGTYFRRPLRSSLRSGLHQTTRMPAIWT